jgi:hypothetical protein
VIGGRAGRRPAAFYKASQLAFARALLKYRRHRLACQVNAGTGRKFEYFCSIKWVAESDRRIRPFRRLS